MCILLTGASGFLGAALTEALLARGERVIGVDRAPPTEAPAGSSYRFVQADLSHPGALDAALVGERIEAVILGAAITADVARERRDPAGVGAVNVAGVADAIRAAAVHGVRRVLILGSGAIYGEAAFTAAILEEEATSPEPRSLYALTKLSGEAIALRLAETFFIRSHRDPPRHLLRAPRAGDRRPRHAECSLPDPQARRGGGRHPSAASGAAGLALRARCRGRHPGAPRRANPRPPDLQRRGGVRMVAGGLLQPPRTGPAGTRMVRHQAGGRQREPL